MCQWVRISNHSLSLIVTRAKAKGRMNPRSTRERSRIYTFTFASLPGVFRGVFRGVLETDPFESDFLVDTGVALTSTAPLAPFFPGVVTSPALARNNEKSPSRFRFQVGTKVSETSTYFL